MKSPVPLLTTPPRGSARKPQPQSAPAALKVVGAPGTTTVAPLVAEKNAKSGSCVVL